MHEAQRKFLTRHRAQAKLPTKVPSLPVSLKKAVSDS
jgi:hypothetical protein